MTACMNVRVIQVLMRLLLVGTHRRFGVLSSIFGIRSNAGRDMQKIHRLEEENQGTIDST